MIDKDLPFYLKENISYHFIGPEDQKNEYKEEFTFEEIKEKMGDMSTYQIGFESDIKKDYNYFIDMKKIIIIVLTDGDLKSTMIKSSYGI